LVREAPDESDEVLAAREDLAAAFGGDGGLVAGEEADAVGDDARQALVLAFAGGVPELLEAAVREGGLAFLEGAVEAAGVRADDAYVVVVVGARDASAGLGGVLDLAVEADVEDGGLPGAVLELELVDDAGEGDVGLVVHVLPPGAWFLWGWAVAGPCWLLSCPSGFFSWPAPGPWVVGAEGALVGWVCQSLAPVGVFLHGHRTSASSGGDRSGPPFCVCG